MLEPYAGKLACTVLRGLGGQQCPPGYPTPGSNLLSFGSEMIGERFWSLSVGEGNRHRNRHVENQALGGFSSLKFSFTYRVKY